MDEKDWLHLKFVEKVDHNYVVYKHRNLIYFIHADHEGIAKSKIRYARERGFGPGTQLTYLATYVFDTRKYEFVKNRYPDQEIPRQVFDSTFSGVLPDVTEL